MTAVDLRGAAEAVDKRRARSRQRALGPSSVGGCQRRAGYTVAGTPRTDDEGSKMAAILGTWLHKGALDVLHREYGAAIEVAVKGDYLTGQLDALYLDSLTVEDVKTTGRFAYEWRLEVGPALEHLFQVHLYAWLLRTGQIPAKGRRKILAAGYRGDDWRIPIEQVVIRYVNRDTGDDWAHTQPYDPEITRQALEWIAEVYQTVAEDGPELLPRGYDGPGLSRICDGCRFRTECWGPQPDDTLVMRQANLVRTDADVAAALAEYAEFRDLEKQAKEGKSLARAKLTGTLPGIYEVTDGKLKLSWSENRDGKPTVDLEKVRALYADAGLEVPVKHGEPTKTIRVTTAR